MKIFKKLNVFEESLNRIRWLFDEFDHVCVNHSGGKDSTVVFELASIVAKEKNRLPLPVMFIDQEGEWDATIDMIRDVMYRDYVKPIWFQGPFVEANATSHGNDEFWLWREGDEWLREKDPIAIHENNFGTDHFYRLFDAIGEHYFGDGSCAMLAGMRAEESPGRKLGLTTRVSSEAASYKWTAWGCATHIYNLYPYTDKALRERRKTEPHVVFSPIYDWSYRDVWKAIHDNNWKYCKIYDYMYSLGVPVHNMRVSSLHHEQAVKSMFYMQELEPGLHNRFTKRLPGVDAASKFGKDNYFPKKLPFMFKDWKEYRDYLLEKLVYTEKSREMFRKLFKPQEKKIEEIGDEALKKHVYQVHVQSILSGGQHGEKITNLNITINQKKRDIEREGKREERKLRLEQEAANAK